MKNEARLHRTGSDQLSRIELPSRIAILASYNGSIVVGPDTISGAERSERADCE